MRDRVILMVGLYDTLDIFTYELKKEFEKIRYLRAKRIVFLK